MLEYWDSPSLKIFRGTVAMTFDDPGVQPKKPSMVHFFYMDEADPSKVSRWIEPWDRRDSKGTGIRNSIVSRGSTIVLTIVVAGLVLSDLLAMPSRGHNLA